MEVSERHDEDDVTFAQEMIPHHAQALRMVEMVERHGASDELADLAAQMETAQEREIGLMEQMLETWGEDLPDSGLMGHGMSGMDGEALERLEDVRPDDFDSMWALMMIQHHEDAIEMSEVELDEGVNPEAHQLARDIIEAQTREIAQLEDIARADRSVRAGRRPRTRSGRPRRTPPTPRARPVTGRPGRSGPC